MQKTTRPHTSWLELVAMQLVLGVQATSQCTPEWLPGFGLPGLDGVGNAMVEWDPDGPGPLGPVVVVAGPFTVAGDAACAQVASYDPTTGAWTALAHELHAAQFGAGTAQGLAVLPTGELVLTGEFTTIDGVTAWAVARYDGGNWSDVGFGLGAVSPPSFAVPLARQNGELIVTGGFEAAPGFTANHIARWNGSSWQPLGSGLGLVPPPATPGTILGSALTTLPNGDLIVGGRFDSAGGLPAANVARFDAVGWAPLTSSNTLLGTVHALLTLPNGDLIAGGQLQISGLSQPSHLARFDGTAWSPLGGGTDGVVYALAHAPGGGVYVGGEFTAAGGNPAANLALWDATGWQPLGAGLDGPCRSLLVTQSGDLYASGEFHRAGTATALRFARWRGGSWSALHGGFDRQVKVVLPLQNGDVVVGGDFEAVDGLTTGGVARFDGVGWQALGNNALQRVTALHELPNGDLLAAGVLVNGISTVPDVRRFDGVNWSSIGVPARVFAFAELPSGELVVGGAFRATAPLVGNNIQRFDGTSWQPLGLGTDARVNTLTVTAAGDLIVGGGFQLAGGNPTLGVARWNGATWQALIGTSGAFGGGNVVDLTELPDGDLIAVGAFPFLMWGGIARWDGSEWQMVLLNFQGFPLAVAQLPGADLALGGSSGPGTPFNNLARWDGSTGSPFGQGVAGYVSDLAVDRAGQLWVAGDFTRAGGAANGFLARLASPCPAMVASYGSGCTGGTGTVTLRADVLPWLGATYRATATGLPANSFAIGLRGLTATALRLAPVLPQAGPGCVLLASPDLLDLLPVQNGVAEHAFAVPLTSALIGQTLVQQVVPVALTTNGQVNAVSTSNGLRLTIGAF